MLLVVVVIAACGAEPATATPQTPFIALASDFSGFQHWRSYDLGVQPTDGLHIPGHRVIYLSHAPPHGSTSFPVGTMLVKTVINDASGETQVFAMAKRGGEYNDAGATGWEWLELASPDGPPEILWRGELPPNSGVYAGSKLTCNSCHTSAANNDSVLATQLGLGTF
jgi:hypothetical protein